MKVTTEMHRVLKLDIYIFIVNISVLSNIVIIRVSYLNFSKGLSMCTTAYKHWTTGTKFL